MSGNFSGEIKEITIGGPSEYEKRLSSGFANRIVNTKAPFKLDHLNLPGNVIDFMNLAYVSLENNSIEENSYYTKKLDYRYLKEFVPKALNGQNVIDFALANLGLKYFTFFNHWKTKNSSKTTSFIQKTNRHQQFIRSSHKLEEMFREIALQSSNANTTVVNVVENLQNNIINTMFIETLKMEEIMTDFRNTSDLNTNGYAPVPNCNHQTPGYNPEQLHGGKDVLFRHLTNILNSIDYSLKNPTVPQGMVTEKELQLELEKLIPGVTKEQLALILSEYTKEETVNFKLTNFLSKAEFETRATAFATKAEVNGFISLDRLNDYYNKRDIDNALARYLTKDEYTPVDAYNKLEIDAKLNNYYEKHIVDYMISSLVSKSEFSETIYRKSEVDQKLSEYIKRSEYTPVDAYSKLEIDHMFLKYYTKEEVSTIVDAINAKIANNITTEQLADTLSIYMTASNVNDIVTSLLTETQAAEIYLSKSEAEATYAKLEDIPTLGDNGEIDLSTYASKTYVDNKATSLKTDIVDNVLSAYAKTDAVDTKFNEYVRNTDFQDLKSNLEGKVTTLESKVIQLEQSAGTSEPGGSSPDVSGEIAALKEADTLIEGRLTLLETDKTEKDAKVAEIEGKVTTLEGKVTALESAGGGQGGSGTDHTADIEALKAKDTEIEGKVTTLEADKTTKDEKIATIESTLANKADSSALAAKADTTALEGKADKSELTAKANQTDLDTANGKITALEAKVAELEQKNTTLEQQLTALTERVTALESPKA